MTCDMNGYRSLFDSWKDLYPYKLEYKTMNNFSFLNRNYIKAMFQANS